MAGLTRTSHIVPGFSPERKLLWQRAEDKSLLPIAATKCAGAQGNAEHLAEQGGILGLGLEWRYFQAIPIHLIYKC